jgi:cell division protein FtsB
MKRPHRSIETFDISLMAVVTKAMGAFLVLMLLLMPYYSSSPLGKDEAQELARKVQDADAKIKNVLDKLGDKDLGKELASASEELGSGAQLINQLKRYVDQLSAQVTRLEEKIVTLTAELDQLKKDKTTLTARVAELEKQNFELKAENEKLKAEIEKLKARIAELEKLVEEQKARIAELEKKIEEMNKELAELRKLEPERVEELKKLIEELKKEIASLKKQVEDLYAQVLTLQDENARLRARIAELEQQNAELLAQVVPLRQENAQQKARIAELEAQIEELQSRGWLAGTARSASCNEPFVVGTVTATTLLMDGSKYLFNQINSTGNGWNSEVFAGSRVSTFVDRRAGVARYFLYLLFRKDENGPLLKAQSKCTAFVTITSAIHITIGHSYYVVTFERGDPYLYFGDVIIDKNGDTSFEDPSPEGKAYLEDQIAHATFASPEQGSAPSSTDVPAPVTEAPPAPAPQAAPNNAPPTPDAGNRRRGRGQ